jgi:hypothetical protein
MERLRFAGNAMLPAKVSTMPDDPPESHDRRPHHNSWAWLQMLRRGLMDCAR